MYAAGQVIVNASQAGFSNDKNEQNKIVNKPNFQKVNEEYEKINRLGAKPLILII